MVLTDDDRTGAGIDADRCRARPGLPRRTRRQEFGDSSSARFLELEISYDDEAQTCTVVLPYAPHLCNPQGRCTAAIITTALDISMGHLCHRFLSTAVTIEMQMRFFRPLTGTGTCTGRLVRAGRRIVTSSPA